MVELTPITTYWIFAQTERNERREIGRTRPIIPLQFFLKKDYIQRVYQLGKWYEYCTFPKYWRSKTL